MPTEYAPLKIVHHEEIAGHTLGYRTHTSHENTQTVVLVHGIGVSSAYYIPLAQNLSVDYEVYALDLPGYGTTPKPNHALTIEELSETLHSFIVHHKLSQPIMVGHSMGCQIIAHYQNTYPDSLNSSILLSPTTNHKERTIFLQALRLFQDTFLETPKANFIIFTDYIRMGIIRFLNTAKFMVNDHIEENLDSTKVPTLLVRGSKDNIAPKDWLAFLKQKSPLITTKEVTGAPHALHFTHTEEVATVCRNFIGK